MKLLIVDDSRAMRSIIRRIAETLGHQTVEAANGLEALDLLQSDPEIGLGLVDWNMPTMDGMGLVRAVRMDERFTGLSLLMVTSETELDKVAEAMEAGADEYLMKPFNADELAMKITLAVEARQRPS